MPDKLPPSTAPRLPDSPARDTFAACVRPTAAASHPGLEPGRYYPVRYQRPGRRTLPWGEYWLVTGRDPARWERVQWDELALVPIEDGDAKEPPAASGAGGRPTGSSRREGRRARTSGHD